MCSRSHNSWTLWNVKQISALHEIQKMLTLISKKKFKGQLPYQKMVFLIIVEGTIH